MHRGMARYGFVALAALALAAPIWAASSQTWRHRTRGEREQGDLKGVSLLNDGSLTLGPALESLAQSADPYLWALARDSRGNIYAGGGSEGKVYRLEKGGKLSLFLDTPELEVHALAVDSKDNLYVGTSPRGKIYRVSPSGKASDFFAPGETYIWSLAFDQGGDLYAATGTEGRIYRVSPSGKGEVFLDTDETHVRILIPASGGGLIAGTDGKGLVLRIDRSGKSTVLANSPLGEVTALAANPRGTIYFAAAGQTAGRGAAARTSPPPASPRPSPAEEERAPGQPPPEPPQPPPTPQPAAPAPPSMAAVESRIVLVEPDGYTREIWTGMGDLILSLAVDRDGTLIAGAGTDGRIYRVDPGRGEATLLGKAESAQVSALLPEPGGSFLVACNNLGALYRLGARIASEGTFVTVPFDAKVFSSWGRIAWKGETPAGSSIALQVRTGNTSDPDATWSDWSPAARNPETLIDRPRARYVQWRATLKSSDGKAAPRLGEVTLNFLQRNLPPELKSVEVQSPGVVFQRPNRNNATAAAPSEGAGGAGRGADREHPARRPPQQPRPQNDKDGRAVQWNSQDPNGDDLQYSVYYRGVDEKEWKLMEKDLTDPFFSWDATSMSDGTYLVRVVADDSPSNPDGAALSSERLSEPFDIDNNPPRVTPIKASVAGSTAKLEFGVEDSFSMLGIVEYSLNAAEWKAINPVDGITDSSREDYRVEISALSPGEYAFVVRAHDAEGNSATAKTLFRANGSR
ncbi:MAG TPA: hypothetical protein VGR67_10205 [Candidatus Polarisedimenticolia bacterium]|nr:hypothetical protein [Candidatus Polarisedimenticolia bacterium]